MAYQVTTKTSYGQRVKNAFGGVGTGILLFILGTALLWWNEGRAVKATKMLNEAQGVTVEMTDITKIDPQFEGKLVHATGPAATLDTLYDSEFGFGANAVCISRSVEYYQWVENASSQTKDKIGGGQETVTTYTYEQRWVSEPVNSSTFQDPSYVNRNRTLAQYENDRQYARNVTFGAYSLNEGQVRSISGSQPMEVSLADEKVRELNRKLNANQYVTRDFVHISGNVIYLGLNPNAAETGDVRITFEKVLPAEVSIMAEVKGNTFTNFKAKNGKEFSAFVTGNRTADEMYEGEHRTNKILLWIFRVLGFLLIVSGLKGIFNILVTLLKVLPFVANIVSFGTNLICNVIAFVWMLTVVAIAWIAYRPVLGIGLLVVAGAAIFFFASRGGSKKAETPVQTPPQTPQA